MVNARSALVAALVLAGCSTATPADHPDARRVDAAVVDADVDASPIDATDAAIDAGPDGALGCTISTGHTVTLDGDGDLAAYPAAQVLIPGVPLAGTDRIAVTWDRTNLYVTATSGSFANAFKPLHVYLQTGDTLPAVAPGTGKEYGGDTPFLPFAASHVIAIRRTDDSGVGGPYDGVYVAGAPVTWATRSFALVPGTHVFASADGLTLSVKTPWSALGGCPTHARLVAHVVHGDVGNDWKDTLPVAHTPWLSPGGAYYQIELTADPSPAGWMQP